MTSVTAADVKKLRQRTSAGMMDCKTALQESAGDIERAIDLLRSKGLARIAKRGDNETLEGMIALHCCRHKGAILEINAETDFVARNDRFCHLADALATQAHASQIDNHTAFLASPWDDDAPTVADHIMQEAAVLGENIRLRRLARLEVKKGLMASYVHNMIAPGIGHIGVIVGLECAAEDAPELAEFGKHLAMHIAAANPLALSVETLNPAIIERERAVLVEKWSGSSKPDHIINTIIDGSLKKIIAEMVLLQQPFVVDTNLTVNAALEAATARIGSPISLVGFRRFQLGESLDTTTAS